MKYLTAKQLKITKDERTALIAVRKFLGKIRNVKDPSSERPVAGKDWDSAKTARFNMNKPLAQYDCGTGGCIRGWMSLFLQGVPLRPVVKVGRDQALEADHYVSEFSYFGKHNDLPLAQLFFPSDTSNYAAITT